MSARADCVVIGGGITGASTAYYLTELGCHGVVLLEKDYLASKATRSGERGVGGGMRQPGSRETTRPRAPDPRRAASVALHGTSRKEGAQPLVAVVDSGWAGKQLIDAVVYMGYLREAEEDKDDWTYTEQVAKLLVDGMPSLSDVGIKRLVDGYCDSTPDGHPFLGAVSGLEGYYQAAGFSGHGYMLPPAVGKVMAELILGQEPSLPIEAFSIDRFQSKTSRDNLAI